MVRPTPGQSSSSASRVGSMLRTLLPSSAALLLVAACGSDVAPSLYDDDALWLCRPGMADDQCEVHDLTATELLPDGRMVEVAHTVADAPAYDCFYVYPTVDLSLRPGNNTELGEDIEFELDPLLGQAARFTRQCRVFAPLYRQVTIGTYMRETADTQSFFDLAYGDIEEAFRHYLDNDNEGRPFVIMGHSQGTHMTTRLLQEVIEPDEALSSRMVVALLIGGAVSTREGETTGGTFSRLATCTSQDELGCVVAYRSYAKELPPTHEAPGPGLEEVCVNPAALDGSRAAFAGTYLPVTVNQSAFSANIEPPPVDTPFLLYRDFYTGACERDLGGQWFMSIDHEAAVSDLREQLIPYDFPLFAPGFLGLHVLDYSFPQEDLLELVAHKASVMAAR